MKIRRLLVLALLAAGVATAQEFELDTNALKQAVEWANENFDENVLRSLPELDREKVEKFLRQFQTQLQGEYVLDVAALKDAVNVVLPLLDAHDETQPYAAWLRSRLYYVEVAEQFRKAAPPPKTVPSQPPPLPPTNPPPDA